MPPIKLQSILSYSSEDPNHPAENLLKSDSYLKWKCQVKPQTSQESVIIKLDKLYKINALDIGNESSALVEVMVGREGVDFKVLLVASSFMSPIESRNGDHPSRVRMFGKDKLTQTVVSEKWDRVKFICTQPFNKSIQFGLSFIRLHCDKDEAEVKSNVVQLGAFTLREDDSDEEVPSMSLFAGRKTNLNSVNKSPKPEIEDSKRKSLNAPELGFYQLKKARQDESQEKKISIDKSADSKGEEKSNDHRKPSNKSDDSQRHTKNEQRPSDSKKESHKPADSKRRSSHKSDDSKRSKNEPKQSDKTNNRREPSENRKRSADTTDVKTPSKRAKLDVKEPKQPSAIASGSTKQKAKPFSKLMQGVVFVLSGYENPQRSQLRDQLTDMGARYERDWGKSCTHLICAFPSTPKYRAVKGKGKIVNEKWVQDAYKKKIRYPWRRYNVEKNRDAIESEDEIWSEELLEKEPLSQSVKKEDTVDPYDCPTDDQDTDDEIERALNEDKPKKPKLEDTKPVDPEYDADTDIDDENQKKTTSHLDLPTLSDHFQGMTFYLYGNLDQEMMRSLERYIIAYSGSVADYMCKDVTYVITETDWNSDFDDAMKLNSSIQFVKPQWVQECCNQQKLTKENIFLIKPR